MFGTSFESFAGSLRRVTGAAIIGAAALALPGTANAVTVDFTDNSAFGNGDLSESYTVGSDSVTVTLTSVLGGAVNFTSFDGDDNVASLAFDNDGVGIGDDEITFFTEALKVDFSKTVKITAFYFLDLFFEVNEQDSEVALVYRDGIQIASFTAQEAFQTQGGFGFFDNQDIIADSLVFKASRGNDGVGSGDYALAALDVAPVPLPAAAWMLLSALGGLFGIRFLRGKTA